MKKLLVPLVLTLTLGGCAETQTVLSDIALTLGTVASIGSAVSSTIPALCAELNQAATTIAQSGVVSASQSAALQSGTNHYNTYCGPIALDAATAATAAAQLQADINALQTP